jgi:hypothetical protein
MKKNVFVFLVAAFAAVISFSSCSKDEEQPATGESVLLVKLPTATSRAISDPVGSNTKTTITKERSLIFLLSGQSVVGAPYLISALPTQTGGAYRIEQVSSSINNVIVVANIPSGDLSNVQGLKNATAIKTYGYTSASQNATATVLDQTLYDEAVVTTDSDPASDGHTYKAATIELEAITARIEVRANAVTAAAGLGITDIKLLGVWINNYYPTHAVTTTQNHGNASAVWDINAAAPSGMTDVDYPTDVDEGTITPPTYNPNTEYYTKATDAAISGSKVYSFHVFPGDEVPHVILLVKGRYAANHFTAPYEYFLKYITINSYKTTGDGAVTITANNVYTISSIPVSADKLTTDPEMAKIDVAVDVDVKAWVLNEIKPDLQ